MLYLLKYIKYNSIYFLYIYNHICIFICIYINNRYRISRPSIAFIILINGKNRGGKKKQKVWACKKKKIDWCEGDWIRTDNIMTVGRAWGCNYWIASPSLRDPSFSSLLSDSPLSCSCSCSVLQFLSGFLVTLSPHLQFWLYVLFHTVKSVFPNIGHFKSDEVHLIMYVLVNTYFNIGVSEIFNNYYI